MAPGGRETHTNNCARDVCQSPTTIGHSSLACLETTGWACADPDVFQTARWPASSPADGVSCRGLHRTDRAGSHRGVSSPVGSPERGDRVGVGHQPGGVVPTVHSKAARRSGPLAWQHGIGLRPWYTASLPWYRVIGYVL